VHEDKDAPEEGDSNDVSHEATMASPKGGLLPTLLFARKHSLNVPRGVVKSAEAEEKKVESLVTQVNKTSPSTPSSRPRSPSARLSQDISTSAATTPTAPPSPSALMSPSAGKAKDFGGRSGFSRGLLGEQPHGVRGRKCLVLDLDETLVHSSFKPTKNADFIIPVEIDGYTHQVYVGKRPHVDEFLSRMGEIYEVVIFTASLPKYANPLLDVLDKPHGVIKWRLFREHCTYHEGCYVKDLSRLGRPMNEVLIVDNATYSYMFQPENAIASDTWNDDPHCMELQTMADYLESIANEPDLRHFTDEWNTSSR